MAKPYLETAGGPLTGNDFEPEAPRIGSSDHRYSKESMAMFDDLSRDVAALLVVAEVVNSDSDFFGDFNPNHDPKNGQFAAGGGGGGIGGAPIPRLEDLKNLEHHDRVQSPELSQAIDRWVGGPFDTMNSGLEGGIFDSSEIDDALTGKNDALRDELITTGEPIRNELREKYGDTIGLYRVSGGAPEGSTSRNAVSMTSNREFAERYAGAPRQQSLFSEEHIRSKEKEFEANGKVSFGRQSLEKVHEGDLHYVAIMDPEVGGFVTDTPGVREYMNERNVDIKASNARRQKALAKIKEHKVPVDDVIWYTNRFNQNEFIVKSAHGARDADLKSDYNPHHEAAGSPEGGRFASGGGAGGDLDLRPGKPMVSQSGYIRVSSRGRDDRDLELFINPTRGTAERVAKESTGRDILLRPELTIRALKDDTGNVFVWKAEDGTHAEVMASLYDSGVKDIHAQTQWWIKEGKLGSEFDSNNEESKSWIGAGQQTAKVAGGKSRKDAALDDADDDGPWLLVTREILRDFNPNHEPAGSSEGGRFASGGGTGGAVVVNYKPGIKTPQDGSDIDAKAVKAGWIEASSVKTMDDVKRGADDAQKMLGDKGREIGERLGLTFKDPGAKTKSEKGVQRVLDKAAERGGNLAAVTDTARATFLVNHPHETDHIIAELGKHFEVAAEPWKVTGMKYGDRAVNVRLPNGVIAEVQMLHPQMAWAKSGDGGGGHDLYKISRVAGPTGTKPDATKYADAVTKQRALYGNVYAGLSDDWKAAFGKAGKSA